MTTVVLFLPGWVGDVVMATPAIRAIRRHYHDVRLIGVMKPYVRDVVAGCGWFDDFLPMKGALPTGWALRALKPNLAVLFPNSFRSGLAAWIGGATRRVGY